MRNLIKQVEYISPLLRWITPIVGFLILALVAQIDRRLDGMDSDITANQIRSHENAERIGRNETAIDFIRSQNRGNQNGSF